MGLAEVPEGTGWRIEYPPVPEGFAVIGFAIRLITQGCYRCVFDGKLVEEYDPDDVLGLGVGHLKTTSEPVRAFRWPSVGAALGAWQAQSKARPLRFDGKPNRPLTCWAIQIEPVAARRIVE